MQDVPMSHLVKEIFECVSRHCNNCSEQPLNSEVIMSHVIAAHVIMSLLDVDFKEQITILRRCVDILEQQKPVQVLHLRTSDKTEPLTNPAN